MISHSKWCNLNLKSDYEFLYLHERNNLQCIYWSSPQSRSNLLQDQPSNWWVLFLDQRRSEYGNWTVTVQNSYLYIPWRSRILCNVSKGVESDQLSVESEFKSVNFELDDFSRVWSQWQPEHYQSERGSRHIERNTVETVCKAKKESEQTEQSQTVERSYEKEVNFWAYSVVVPIQRIPW